MNKKHIIVLLILFVHVTMFAANDKQLNVLLIAVDDLNDWIGCLGGHPDAKTPNIDKLASRGILFTNAHCQGTMGNPSRISSIRYTAPFEVQDGTTVRAVLKLDDEVLFTMEEKFGATEGLFWGNEHSEDIWAGRGMTMQAEDGELTGGAKIIVILILQEYTPM